MVNCGLCTSEFDLLGLLSSSDRERLIGPDIPGRGAEFDVDALANDLVGSEDQAGMGGRLIPGDMASFLAGGWPALNSRYNCGGAQSAVC